MPTVEASGCFADLCAHDQRLTTSFFDLDQLPRMTDEAASVLMLVLVLMMLRTACRRRDWTMH
jgi:hypothetical protein